MAGKNAAWRDTHNPTLAQFTATASNATVTQAVAAIISNPVTASTSDHVIAPRKPRTRKVCR